MRRLLLASLAVLIGCHHTVQTNLSNLSDGAVVEAIQVAGNQAISTETIKAKIQTKAGDRINGAAIKRDITSVRSLGFDDVQVREENGTSGGRIIVFSVRERSPKPSS